MKRLIALLAAAALWVAVPAYALYDVMDRGDWPKTWPPAIEALRDRARTLVGPVMANRHYAIPFAEREEFEAAWEHLLKVKTKGAPVFLVRGPNFFLGEDAAAGVVVHCPPKGQHDNQATPEAPITGVEEPHLRWMNTSYLELVVDGRIVDLNRIPLPADTPIIDERFEEKGSK